MLKASGYLEKIENRRNHSTIGSAPLGIEGLEYLSKHDSDHLKLQLDPRGNRDALCLMPPIRLQYAYLSYNCLNNPSLRIFKAPYPLTQQVSQLKSISLLKHTQQHHWTITSKKKKKKNSRHR